MARQRKYLLPVAAVLLGILGNRPVAAETPDILPPSPFAVEMPADTTTLSIGNLPIRDILARIKAGGDRVTMDLPRERIGPGAWRVLLSAWDPEMRDRPVARREAVLFVLPHGMTPVGATGVGGGAEIARDDFGFLHMVWTDDWRPGARPGAMYRRGRVLPDGGVQFDTDIVDLAQQHKGNFTAEPALAAAGDTVHFIWQAEGTIWYRSLHKAGDSWRWSDEVDTKAPARDQGAAIAADPTAVHILTVDGKYLTSRDGGRSWSTEAVPFGTFARLGSVSLTLDATGRPLAAASVLVSEAGPPAVAPDGGGQGARGQGASGQGARGSGAGGQDAGGGEATRAGVAPVAAAGAKGARWTVRLARRIGNGAWQVLPGPLDGRPEWTSPERPDQDVLCASFRVPEDAGGAMVRHLGWHAGRSRGDRVPGILRVASGWRRMEPANRARDTRSGARTE